MAKALSILLVVCVLAVGSAYGQSTARIANTPHNINNIPVIQRLDGQICVPCHAPHANAQTSPDQILWNHALPDTGSFAQYVTTTGNTGTLNGTSKLCLSCHDGVTAIDNYGGTTTGGSTITMDHPSLRDKKLDIDLTDDHPIGIDYPSDPAEYNPAGSLPNIKLFSFGGGPARVECGSCHDPHNNAIGNFLRVPTAGSQLCLECHNK